jgi:hypothetical protein
MEGNLSQGGMIPAGGASFEGFDLHGSMRVHHQAQHPFIQYTNINISSSPRVSCASLDSRGISAHNGSHAKL